MSQIRKTHRPSFKAKVALAALKGEQTMAQVAAAALTRRGGPLVGRGFYAGGHPLYFDPETCQLEPGQSHSWKYGCQAVEVGETPKRGWSLPSRWWWPTTWGGPSIP